jgi:hypothetical protein
VVFLIALAIDNQASSQGWIPRPSPSQPAFRMTMHQVPCPTLKKRTPSSRRHLVNFVFSTKSTFRYYVDVASCMICYWQYTVWYSTESIAIYSTKFGQYWLQVSRHISHMAHGMLINESWPRRVMKGTGYIWIGVTNGKPFQQLDWWNLTLKFNRNLSCEIVLYIYKDL